MSVLALPSRSTSDVSKTVYLPGSVQPEYYSIVLIGQLIVKVHNMDKDFQFDQAYHSIDITFAVSGGVGEQGNFDID